MNWLGNTRFKISISLGRKESNLTMSIGVLKVLSIAGDWRLEIKWTKSSLSREGRVSGNNTFSSIWIKWQWLFSVILAKYFEPSPCWIMVYKPGLATQNVCPWVSSNRITWGPFRMTGPYSSTLHRPTGSESVSSPNPWMFILLNVQETWNYFVRKQYELSVFN